MKRIFLSILAVASLAGCAKIGSELVEVQENGGFSIYVSAPQTKTSFDEETYAVTWSKGDALAVTIDGVLYKFTNSTGEGNEFTCSDFTPEDGVTYTYDILYPYSANGQFTMSGGVKTPMHGTATATGSESPTVALSQLSALIKVTISNESGTGTAKLTSLRIERADGGVLGGKHTVDGPVEGATVSYTTVESQNKAIPAGESIDMFLQCAPFTASAGTSLNIIYTVNGTAYTAVKTFTRDVKFEAGKVNRTAVSFEIASSKKILIDFGAKTTDGWNNVSSASASGLSLTYSDGSASDIKLTAGAGWSLQNPVSGEPNLAVTFGGIQYPQTVWYDSFTFTGTSGDATKTIEFSGLSADAKYNFTVCAYRWNGSVEARQTQFSLTGSEKSETKSINQGTKDSKLSDIDNHFAVFENVSPSSEGKIVLNVTAIQKTVCQAHLSAIVIEECE